ncbi:hypothetical protein EWM64_g7648 [Hericium alpestre]|uniref:Protein YTP1-like C-terminal domain-containing protein n=1 Tax=Hericium alpestre TaxID=135208 RepID=A0A4Y9ZQ24_9AGAM|nr:hypothetical protein EWM64_g7648 [Hericium alpestre]
MHLPIALGFLLPSLALYAAGPAGAAPSFVNFTKDVLPRDPSSSKLPARAPLEFAHAFERRAMDEHSHGGHHAAPLLEINETEVHLWHAVTPPSYYTVDIGNPDPAQKRYPGLMALHVLSMCAAFFGALPAGIALRSVNHAWHGFSMLLFWAFVIIGVSASGLYSKLTPNMYEGQKHTSHSYFVLLLALIVSAVDLIAGVSRLINYVKAVRAGEPISVRSFWRTVVLGQDEQPLGLGAEYANLVVDDPEELEDELKGESISLQERRARRAAPLSVQVPDPHDETASWANEVQPHEYPETPASERTLFGPRSPRGSQHSDDTLHEYKRFGPRASLLRRVGRIAFGTLERVLVFAGFIEFLTGSVLYTGICRENYVNGCLAHLIKGGIFWCYGLATFARFLGSFSDLGWAWNRVPVGDNVSAEFVESAVIFVYGITNTWMERFGANPGDPYTTKEVQHISIAVMFWFAGLLGMSIESRCLRRWFAAVSTAALKKENASREAVAEPASYSGSFNPFPALVIGITGAAMSAHHQTYQFQVEIHMLWGYLLSAFAVLRCLTYFFLWMGPPRSVLPSRPPTEALASFFLACGGLVFIFSDEEITLNAMRMGHDDMMMFLNLSVAITCFAMCWTLVVVGFKGWLKSRTHAALAFYPST